MSEIESAEALTQSILQAVADDHLLSREALPLFVADEIRADRDAVRVALLDELEQLTVTILRERGDNDVHMARGIAIERLEAKYQTKGASDG